MQFKDVIGQEKIKEQLCKSVQSGRIPHAQMFYGPEGSGSLALAIAYAQYVACTNRKEFESCGSCPSCKKFDHLTHPDLHFSFPVNKTKTITKEKITSDDFIKTWRNFIQQNSYFLARQWYVEMGIENKQGFISVAESSAIIQKLNLKPFESEYKFLIMWLPEKMRPECANKLLKLVEEPPEKTLFLFVSDIPEEVLLTISSRTQPVKLSRLTDEEISGNLQKRFQLEASRASSIARLAKGNFIEALEFYETSDEGEFNLEMFTQLMRQSYMREIPELSVWVEKMASIGRERLKGFFLYAIRLVRENFIMNLKNEEIIYLTDEEASFSARFHPYINGRNILAISNEINSASGDIERNANPKVVLFDMALKIVKLIRK
jgi:DNA polymerase-3 subunit delta'